MSVFALIGFTMAGLVAGIIVGVVMISPRIRHAQSIVTTEKLNNLQTEVERLNTEVNKGIFDILALYEFTTVLGSISNLGELYNMMVDTMLRIIRYDACAIFLVKSGEPFLDLAVARGFSKSQTAKLARIHIEAGLAGRAVQTGQPQIINDVDVSEIADDTLKELPFKSILCIPFIVHGEALGVLNLYLEKNDGFSQDDLRILFIIANQAAFAIQNGQLYEKVAEQATKDGLTGLYNHRVFREKIEAAVSEAQAGKSNAAMIMIDVDEFKSVNDSFGHQRGDDVLKEMAMVLADSVRETDIVSRYGGEEFAVILPKTPLSEALLVARRIHTSVVGHDFDGLRLTVSVGLAVYPSPGVSSTDELISAADEHAYKAKAQGKNQICYYAS